MFIVIYFNILFIKLLFLVKTLSFGFSLRLFVVLIQLRTHIQIKNIQGVAYDDFINTIKTGIKHLCSTKIYIIFNEILTIF